MIAKRVPRGTGKRSSFSGLVRYLTDSQGKQSRVDAVTVTNCATTDVQWANFEIEATQSQNRRARSDKTYHLVVAFPPGEVPSRDQLRDIEETICRGLGYEDHQRISVVHADTDSYHFHVAINKIHPVAYTIHEPYYDHKKLGELCAELEIKHGLTRTNHQALQRGSQSRAAALEIHGGVESLAGWIKRNCLDGLAVATSWEQVHKHLKEHGLELRERGNGLIFESPAGLAVKASTVARELSKRGLESRLGPFMPNAERAEIQAKKQYRQAPIRGRQDTARLYARYKAEQTKLAVNRSVAVRKLRDELARKLEATKRSGKLRRAVIKAAKMKPGTKKALRTEATRALKRSLERVRIEHRKRRATTYASTQRLAWADWLQAKARQGDEQALAVLRGRAPRTDQNALVIGAGKTTKRKLRVDTVTKQGTVIYRAGGTVVRDEGARLVLGHSSTETAVLAALTVAQARYGNHIKLQGTAAFQEQAASVAAKHSFDITFDNPQIEARRVALTKEYTDARQRDGQPGPTATSGHGRVWDGGAGGHRGAAAQRGRDADGAGGADARERNARDIGRIGRNPPPEAKHRMRAMSQLGVVQLASGSPVLLPGNVRHDLDDQGAERDNRLRRDVSRSGGLAPEAIPAALKYIGEREAKRHQGFDIMKHRAFAESDTGLREFAGLRKVEGSELALFKIDGEIVVIPVGKTEAVQLGRKRLGAMVEVAPSGQIKVQATTRSRK